MIVFNSLWIEDNLLFHIALATKEKLFNQQAPTGIMDGFLKEEGNTFKKLHKEKHTKLVDLPALCQKFDGPM